MSDLIVGIVFAALWFGSNLIIGRLAERTGYLRGFKAGLAAHRPSSPTQNGAPDNG